MPNCCFCGKIFFSVTPRTNTYQKNVNRSKNELFFMHEVRCLFCTDNINEQFTKSLLAEVFESQIKPISNVKVAKNGWQNIISRIFQKSEKLQQPSSTQACFKHLSKENGKLIYEENCEDQNMFIPKINRNLLPRFIRLLSGYEQYLFALSSKQALKMMKLQPLIIAKTLKLSAEDYYFSSFCDSNVLVTESVHISKIDSYSRTLKYLCHDFFTSLNAKTLMVNAKVIVLLDIQISAANFFLLLSPKTIRLKCVFVEFTTTFKPATLIHKLPSLQKLFFYSNTLEFDIPALQKLLNYCNDLERFIITLTEDDLDFLKNLLTSFKNETTFCAETDSVYQYIFYDTEDLFMEKLLKFSLKIDESDLFAKKLDICSEEYRHIFYFYDFSGFA